jgi:uncharacterized protein
VICPDVNVLVAAMRPDISTHTRARAWLDEALTDSTPIALSDTILVGVIRVLTHRRILGEPETTDSAIAYVEALRSHPNCVVIRPGDRFWKIFLQLCEHAEARGNLVVDAQHAALAIEHGCEFITFDRDYARFRGLRYRTP